MQQKKVYKESSTKDEHSALKRLVVDVLAPQLLANTLVLQSVVLQVVHHSAMITVGLCVYLARNFGLITYR